MNSELRNDPFVQHLADHLDRLAERADTDVAATPAGLTSADLETTSAVVAQLRAASTWIEPPPDLRAKLLARVLAAESEQAPADLADLASPGDASPSEASSEHPSPDNSSSENSSSGTTGSVEDNVRPLAPRRRRLLWAVPIAAVAAVAFTFSVLAIDRALEDEPAKGRTYIAAGTSLAPEAGARVTVAAAPAGFAVVIDAHDLPASAQGSYYTAWLSGPQGAVPIGSLHARKSRRPITMWSGVDPAAYPTFLLTLQKEGETPTPSRLVVLKASLT